MSPRKSSLKEGANEQRRRPPGLVYVELASSNGGMMRDVSEKDFSMRAMMPVNVGDATSFSFSMDATTRVEGRARVTWIEEEGRVAGLEFIEMSPAVRDQFEQWLNKLDEPTTPIETGAAPKASEVSTLEQLREEIRGVAPRPQVQALAPNLMEAPSPATPVPPTVREQPGEFHFAESDPAEGPALLERRFRSKIAESEMSRPSHHRLELPPTSQVDSSPEPPIDQPVPPTLEPLPGDHPGISPVASRSAIFLAVRMLLFLAAVAAAVVYRRDVGNDLVWLGNKLSGSPNTVVTQPANTESVR